MLGANHNAIPVIFDNVTCYTHAVIVGDVKLHNGCIIGAQSFVNCDVQENCLIVGVPGRVVGKNGSITN